MSFLFRNYFCCKIILEFEFTAMKRVCITLVLCAVCGAGYSNDPPRLEAFLGKIKMFYNRYQTSWYMPVQKTKGQEMILSPELNLSMTDHETDLQYAPARGTIFHSKLNMGFDITTGIIYDFKTGRKYYVRDLQSMNDSKALL